MKKSILFKVSLCLAFLGLLLAFGEHAGAAALAFSPVAMTLQRNCDHRGVAGGVGNILVPGIDIVISPDQLLCVNFYPKVKSITATLTVAEGGTGQDQKLFFGGALSNATILWQNGNTTATSGGIFEILQHVRANLGAICWGFALRCIDENNVGNPAALATAAPYFAVEDTFGREANITEFNMTTNQTRKDQDTSIEVQFEDPFNMTSTASFNFVATEGTMTFTWYFYPGFSK